MKAEFFWRELRRQAVKILLVVLFAGFLGATLVRFAPGFGVNEEELDTRLNDASKKALRDAAGSNDSLVGFYLHYLRKLAQGDLGYSVSLQRPVSQLLVERFPETMKSVGLGLLTGWTLGFAVALMAILFRACYFDLFSDFLSGLLLCIPAAVFALFFILVQAPPRLILGLIVFPKVFRYAHSLLQRASIMPHVLTALAKGVGRGRLLIYHILPVIAAPLLAVAGVSVSIAFAAAIPIEALCDLPGVGQLAWKAAQGRDLALLVNLTMIVSIVTLVANSVSDLAGHTLTTEKA